MRLSIYSRANKRAGQWSTKGCYDRLINHGFKPEQITLSGLILTVEDPDRARLDRAMRTIDVYAGCRVPRIYQK